MRGDYSRVSICDVCPFKGCDIDKVSTPQEDYHRSSMIGMAIEGKGVWTCLKHLHEKQTSFKPQCHIGMKEYTRAIEIIKKGELND